MILSNVSFQWTSLFDYNCCSMLSSLYAWQIIRFVFFQGIKWTILAGFEENLNQEVSTNFRISMFASESNSHLNLILNEIWSISISLKKEKADTSLQDSAKWHTSLLYVITLRGNFKRWNNYQLHLYYQPLFIDQNLIWCNS